MDTGGKSLMFAYTKARICRGILKSRCISSNVNFNWTVPKHEATLTLMCNALSL